MNDTSENRDARPRGGEYHIGDAVDVITDLEVSPALIAPTTSSATSASRHETNEPTSSYKTIARQERVTTR